MASLRSPLELFFPLPPLVLMDIAVMDTATINTSCVWILDSVWRRFGSLSALSAGEKLNFWKKEREKESAAARLPHKQKQQKIERSFRSCVEWYVSGFWLKFCTPRYVNMKNAKYLDIAMDNVKRVHVLQCAQNHCDHVSRLSFTEFVHAIDSLEHCATTAMLED